MNTLIGSIKHCEKDRIEVWINSALKNCDSQVVLIILDLEIPKSILELEHKGVKLIHTPTENNTDINICKWERHFYVRQYINTLPKDDIVLVTDTLDVVFQDDPFKWYAKNKTKNLLLISEGITHANEPWNMTSILKDYKEFVKEIQHKEVINSGIIIGNAKDVSDLLLHIYLTTKGLSPESADQPALNITLLSSGIINNTQIVNSNENFAINCAVAGPTECFKLWGFENTYLYNLPIFDGISVNNKNGYPYCIVHQYNRIKEWNEYFVEKYKDINSKPIEENKIENNNTAVVICSKSNSAYHTLWQKELKFTKDEFILCDVGSDLLAPLDFLSNFYPDNIVNYTEKNLRKTFNFDHLPSDKHWWNSNGNRNIIWFYPHFRMMYFYKICPDYDYYWFFDDDVTFPNNELYKFVDTHKKIDHDCLITYIFTNEKSKNPSEVLTMDSDMGSYHSEDFNWLTHYPGQGDLQPIYVSETYGSYFPLVRLSNRALKILIEEHENGFYGYSEGFVPTILNYRNLRLYSIYNKNSNVNLDENIIVNHRGYNDLIWKNV